MPRTPTDTHKFTVIPDWVCEIVSPSTQSRDLLYKMPRYLEAGVAWAWLVYPADRRIDVMQQEGDTWDQVTFAEGPVRAHPRRSTPSSSTAPLSGPKTPRPSDVSGYPGHLQSCLSVPADTIAREPAKPRPHPYSLRARANTRPRGHEAPVGSGITHRIH